MNLEQVLELAGTARSGYELASFKEAGLPVFLLTVRVLTLERKPLGPIDEGVLKAVDAGLNNPDDISEFLGLTLTVLTPVLAGLNTTELINYVKGAGDVHPVVSITSKGRIALSAASTIRPQERTVKICLDALTKRLLFISPIALYKPRDMRELGLFEVPTGSAKRPELEDIPIQDFDRVLTRQHNKEDSKSELLSLRRIERRELHYLPCVMLFYRNLSQRQEVDVGFWRDDGPALEHETRFREFGGPDVVGAKLLSNGQGEPSSDVVEQVAEHVSSGVVRIPCESDAPSTSISPNTAVEPLAVASFGETIQSVLCHEHPGLLRKALLGSRTRLMIISPWIRHQVVNWEFVASLEALLRRGVDVYIGYGLDDGDGKGDAAQRKLPITLAAEKDLRRLAGQYRNFRFVFVGNTHRKTLVSDDTFAVVTSFNWLSFKGDPKDKPRDEHGLVIRKKEYVDREFQTGLNLLENGYAGRASARNSLNPRGGTMSLSGPGRGKN